MAEQSTILDTIKAKLIQANTDTTSDAGRTAIAGDIAKLLEQLTNIGEQTNYNGRQLISGSDGASAASVHTFQIGEKDTDTIKTASINANTTGLSLGALSAAAKATLTKTIAAAQQTVVNKAITTLNSYRADIGSTQNQVESAVRNLMTQSTNLSAAESVIRDVDYAEESANFNKQNIISQAGSYAISQANTVQQNVLKLLQ